ncbi:MAG: metal-dependent transcriptional regulator, partial [Gemmataceae bacterium]
MRPGACERAAEYLMKALAPQRQAAQNPDMTVEQPSTAVQDYLKAIHRLGGATHTVSPAEIATLLNVKAPSVTGMLKRLHDSNWISYTPGTGAMLSDVGLLEARRVIRRHRLIELFLTKVLHLDWSEVDAEAEALEHAISPRLEQAIADFLGEPREDPHGHLIPSSDGTLHTRVLECLSDFENGQFVVIREVQDDDPARLRQWQQDGLVPGQIVQIVAYRPLDDVFQLSIQGRALLIGRRGLEGLRGELCSEPPSDR